MINLEPILKIIIAIPTKYLLELQFSMLLFNECNDLLIFILIKKNFFFKNYDNIIELLCCLMLIPIWTNCSIMKIISIPDIEYIAKSRYIRLLSVSLPI